MCTSAPVSHLPSHFPVIEYQRKDADVPAGHGAGAGDWNSAWKSRAGRGLRRDTASEQQSTSKFLKLPFPFLILYFEEVALMRSTTRQNFTGNLGGLAAEPITPTRISQRPFAVDGETFATLSAAVQRSCGIQHTGCTSAANAGHDGKDGSGLTVGMCDAQQCEY